MKWLVLVSWLYNRMKKLLYVLKRKKRPLGKRHKKWDMIENGRTGNILRSYLWHSIDFMWTNVQNSIHLWYLISEMNPFKASISFENIAHSSSSGMLHCKLNHMRNEPHFIENKFDILIIVKRLREKVREKNIIRMLFIILITAEGNKFSLFRWTLSQ